MSECRDANEARKSNLRLSRRGLIQVALAAGLGLAGASIVKAENNSDLRTRARKNLKLGIMSSVYIAQAARNNDTQAVLLMLEAGLPVMARGQHRGTPLHWAAWHGNLALVQALLRSNPPLEDAENDFDATPLGWATHGSEHGWHRRTGNYLAVVAALLEAGAKLLETASGTDPVKEVLRRHGSKD